MQNGSPRILETMTLDRHGELTESIQRGRVTDALENIDDPLKTTVTLLDCTATWKCRADTVTTEVPGSFSRQSRYTYNAAEDLSDVESLFQGSAQLHRVPASPGASVAPVPASASTDGWRRVLHLEYDQVGNIALVQGAGAPEACVQSIYDDLFGQFPQTIVVRQRDVPRRQALASSGNSIVARPNDAEGGSEWRCYNNRVDHI